MSLFAANPVIVPDREHEEDKSHDSSGSRIRCPLCGWSPRKRRHLDPPSGIRGTRSTLAGLPRLPPAVDFNQMPLYARWSPHSDWYAQ